jgi:hypothetical protein
VGGACGTHRRGERSVKSFGGEAEGKRSLVRPRRRWENGIRMDLGESDWTVRGVEWIQLAQDRDWWQALVNTVMNLLVLAPRR